MLKLDEQGKRCYVLAVFLQYHPKQTSFHFILAIGTIMIVLIWRILGAIMAVQQNRKSRSRRDMRRSHDRMVVNTLSIDSTTGEKHLRHHATKDGFYRGRQLFKVSQDS